MFKRLKRALTRQQAASGLARPAGRQLGRGASGGTASGAPAVAPAQAGGGAELRNPVHAPGSSEDEYSDDDDRDADGTGGAGAAAAAAGRAGAAEEAEYGGEGEEYSYSDDNELHSSDEEYNIYGEDAPDVQELLRSHGMTLDQLGQGQGGPRPPPGEAPRQKQKQKQKQRRQQQQQQQRRRRHPDDAEGGSSDDEYTGTAESEYTEDETGESEGGAGGSPQSDDDGEDKWGAAVYGAGGAGSSGADRAERARLHGGIAAGGGSDFHRFHVSLSRDPERGLGLQLGCQREEPFFVWVDSVIEGSPADDLMMLKHGDVLVDVNGHDISGQHINDCVHHLKETDLRLVFLRPTAELAKVTAASKRRQRLANLRRAQRGKAAPPHPGALSDIPESGTEFSESETATGTDGGGGGGGGSGGGSGGGGGGGDSGGDGGDDGDVLLNAEAQAEADAETKAQQGGGEEEDEKKAAAEGAATTAASAAAAVGGGDDAARAPEAAAGASEGGAPASVSFAAGTPKPGDQPPHQRAGLQALLHLAKEDPGARQAITQLLSAAKQSRAAADSAAGGSPVPLPRADGSHLGSTARGGGPRGWQSPASQAPPHSPSRFLRRGQGHPHRHQHCRLGSPSRYGARRASPAAGRSSSSSSRGGNHRPGLATKQQQQQQQQQQSPYTVQRIPYNSRPRIDGYFQTVLGAEVGRTATRELGNSSARWAQFMARQETASPSRAREASRALAAQLAVALGGRAGGEAMAAGGLLAPAGAAAAAAAAAVDAEEAVAAAAAARAQAQAEAAAARIQKLEALVSNTAAQGKVAEERMRQLERQVMRRRASNAGGSPAAVAAAAAAALSSTLPSSPAPALALAPALAMTAPVAAAAGVVKDVAAIGVSTEMTPSSAGAAEKRRPSRQGGGAAMESPASSKGRPDRKLSSAAPKLAGRRWSRLSENQPAQFYAVNLDSPSIAPQLQERASALAAARKASSVAVSAAAAAGPTPGGLGSVRRVSGASSVGARSDLSRHSFASVQSDDSAAAAAAVVAAAAAAAGLPPPSGNDDSGGGGSSSAGGEGAARQRVTPGGVHRRVASRGHSELGLWTVKVVVEKMRGFEAFGLSMPYVEVSVAGETKRAISLIPPTTSVALRASHSNARRGAAVSLSGTEDRSFNQEFRFTVLDATRALVISVKDLQKNGGSSAKGLIADSKVPLSSCTPNELKRGYFRTYFPGKGGKPAGEVLLSVLLIRPDSADPHQAAPVLGTNGFRPTV